MSNGGFFMKWWIALAVVAVILMLHDTIIYGGKLGPTGKWAILVGLAAVTAWQHDTMSKTERRVLKSVNRKRQTEAGDQKHMYSVR